MASTWTAAELRDQTGRTVIVTGASSGIGLVAARELARVGARVVLAVRNPERGADAARQMTGDTEVRRLDVSDLSSVREFASEWRGDVDVLINNAGIMQVPFARTADGHELQFATNYLGPFLLTALLLPRVTDRVVTVSSNLHLLGRVHLDDLDGLRRRYSESAAYNDSKLADALFAIELGRRLEALGSPVRSVIAHPGVATTKLIAHRTAMAAVMSLGLRFMLNDVAHGAFPTLFAATEDVPSGAYVGPDGPGGFKGNPRVGHASRTARDPELARRLWVATSELLGVPAELSQ